jgi:FMN phosphatase YigB (HAD superfamily)
LPTGQDGTFIKKIARQPCTFSPVMQLFGSSDEKGSLLNRTANRAKMLTERDACVTPTRCDVLVESSLLPEGRAELHACRLVALRVADAYRKLGYRGGLANRNFALMTNMAKLGGLPWDLILGSDLVKHYKPDREMYLSAPFYLDLKPEEVMTCAAHIPDLQAARSCGLRTGFIYRPNEFGGAPVGVPDKAEPGDFDVVSGSIIDLAQQIST